MSQNNYRENLPTVPKRMRHLPVRRGYPVPWFVSLVDGAYDFRVADAAKLPLAIRKRLCWICGEPLGSILAFNIGPMCSVNRISSEPPAHRECAEFSATACPFLNQTQHVRRDNDLPRDMKSPSGIAILRQPGAVIVWLTQSYSTFKVPNGMLIRIGRPTEVLWFTRGRRATRSEAQDAFESGLPTLRDAALADPRGGAVENLEEQIERARKILPDESPRPKFLFGSAAKR